MAEGNDQEKAEDPTPQRREDFRRRGQIAQSKEIGSVFILLASMIAIWALSRFFLIQLHEVFTRSFTDFVIMSARQEDWFAAIKFAATKAALIIIPLGSVLWLIGVAGSVVQVGFVSSEEALKFDLTRLNPVQGFFKIASLRSLVEGAKSVIKVCIVSTIVYLVLKSEVHQLPHLMHFNIEQLMTYLGTISLKLFGGVIAFMGILAGADYFFQWWELEKQMRMTKQEVKEEIKSREGDPMIRARIRKLQREMSQRRMMDDVKKADVIITNPTHIAVAIRYSANMAAPQIIAKGAGEIAEKIKEVAREHKIPIMENKPLARTIYKTIKIGQAIPRELYTAVAEVLSYIYRLKKKRF
ncbi:MAG: flagellar biosynthesis protein FlhB [Bdellovibrionota bacterium]